MEDRVAKLESEVREIKERNARVENDKRWETSSARIVTIAVIIYTTASLFLFVSSVRDYLIAALIPTVGYVLSVQTLPILKRHWNKFLKE